MYIQESRYPYCKCGKLLYLGNMCPDCLEKERQKAIRSRPFWYPQPVPPPKELMPQIPALLEPPKQQSLAEQYPEYYKSVKGLDYIDVYQVHKLFNVLDPSGTLQHASKKLLLSGIRTGGKSQYKDVKEARDTLNRWLEMNKEAA